MASGVPGSFFDLVHGIRAAQALLCPSCHGRDAMTDDTAITDRLRKLAETEEDELAAETIVLDESDIMPTREMRRLLDPAGEFIASLDDDDSE